MCEKLLWRDAVEVEVVGEGMVAAESGDQAGVRRAMKAIAAERKATSIEVMAKEVSDKFSFCAVLCSGVQCGCGTENVRKLDGVFSVDERNKTAGAWIFVVEDLAAYFLSFTQV